MLPPAACGLVPDLATVPLQHVAQGERGLFGADLHGLVFPQRKRVARHRRPGPSHVQFGVAVHRSRRETQTLHRVAVAQPRREKGERLHEREAVDAQPELLVHGFKPARHTERSADALAHDAEQVRRPHALERELRLERVGVFAQRRIEPLRQALGFGCHDLHELFAAPGLHVGEGRQVLRRGADVGRRRAHARGKRLQQPAARSFLVEQPSHILQRQHQPGDRAGRIAEWRRLDLEQAASRGCDHEAGTRRRGARLAQALQLFQRVRDLVAVDQREHRAPETHQRRNGRRLARGKQSLRPLVVEQDPALRIAHHDALGQLRHQSRQAIALLLEPGARFPGAQLEIAPQRAVRVGQPVDRRGRFGHLAPALRRYAQLGVRAQHHTGLLG